MEKVNTHPWENIHGKYVIKVNQMSNISSRSRQHIIDNGTSSQSIQDNLHQLFETQSNDIYGNRSPSIISSNVFDQNGIYTENQHQLETLEVSLSEIMNSQDNSNNIVKKIFDQRRINNDLHDSVINNLNNQELQQIYMNHYKNHSLSKLLLKLCQLRDKLLRDKPHISSDINEILADSIELINQEIFHKSYDHLDSEIQMVISSLIEQIAKICNNEVELVNYFIETKNEFERTISILKDSISEHESSQQIIDNSKSTRQNMDPMAVLWFIKYLIDHGLEKPDKKHLHLLSLWTSVPEHDINRWFIRTMGNYVKKLNDVEKTREKLKERAINTTRQLRKPNSLRTSSESRQAVSQRNLPYKRPTRGRRGKNFENNS